MKKWLCLVLCILMMTLAFSGCSGKGGAKDPSASNPAPTETASDGEMPTVLNTAEYTLYQNIFFNDMKKDYAGKETVKEGTFATLHDAYNDVTRYYVWGYNDQTKCCDWQWEIKFDDGNSADIPANGSLVEIKGVYEENEDALDKFWIVNPQVTVKKAFKARDYDIDMKAMDNTLERVQATNIVNKSEAFEGKTFCAYGRVLNENTLEDPYYDNSWTIGMAGDFETPAFGTLVELSGKISGGHLTEVKITPNTQY